MNRHIVRFFSYVLYIALLIFLAGTAGWLLQLLLQYTPLRGENSPPGSADLVRATVLWVVSWGIGLPFVIYFYRLIRRDMKSDPTASGGGTRAFFLNFVEALSVPIAVSVAAFAVIQPLGQLSMASVTTAAAFAILSLALVAWLERDRQQAPAASPAALVFQRLHLYGIQLILLFILTNTWLWVMRQLIDTLLFDSQGAISSGAPPYCGGFTACASGPNLLSLTIAMIWVALFWIGYSFLVREDSASRWYQVVYLLGLAWGIGYALFGIERGVELLLLTLSGVPVPLRDITGPAASYDFLSPLVFGLIVVGVYGFWLRRAGRQRPIVAMILALWAEAITAALLAIIFWWGIELVLQHVFETITGTQPDIRNWMQAFALVITGIAYIPVNIHLYRQSFKLSIIDPLRTFVLAFLSGGLLTGVIGTGFALYVLGTSLLGSPLNNWQQGARSAIAAAVVGVIVLSIYLRIALHQHFFDWLARSKASAQASKPPASATIPEGAAPLATPIKTPSTIESVLDELLAGKITREEAAARIRNLIGTGESPTVEDQGVHPIL